MSDTPTTGELIEWLNTAGQPMPEGQFRRFGSKSAKRCLEAADRLESLDAVERLRPVYDAARGLCFGEDWNNGTHAKLHGYKQKLKDAVKAAREPEKGGG